MTEQAAAGGDGASAPSISPTRQEELAAHLFRRRNEGTSSKWTAPFAGVRLSGADISWLLTLAAGEALNLEGAQLFGAHLEGASLARVCLKGSNLIRSRLAKANLSRANLAGADLTGAYLQGADLTGANLVGADLSVAQMQGAILEGADLRGARLHGVCFDDTSRLAGVELGPGKAGDLLDLFRLANRNAMLSDIRWQGTHLGDVPWDLMQRLGEDRRRAYASRFHAVLELVTLTVRSGRYVSRARAYQQLADELMRQNLQEPAERFIRLARRQQRYARLARLLYGLAATPRDRSNRNG